MMPMLLLTIEHPNLKKSSNGLHKSLEHPFPLIKDRTGESKADAQPKYFLNEK